MSYRWGHALRFQGPGWRSGFEQLDAHDFFGAQAVTDLTLPAQALAQHDPDDWLLDGDSRIAELIEANDQGFKVHLNRYKYAERYPEQPMEIYRAAGALFLQQLDELLTDRDYLLADHPCLADIALLPFVRQFAHVDREWFAQTPYVRLQAWLQRFLESELFTTIMKK